VGVSVELSADSGAFKRSAGGLIPQDWDVRPLRECLRSPPDYGINAAAVTHRDDLPTYIRITDITDDGRFLPQPRVAVDDHRSGNYFLASGDLVFARTGASVGKSFLYNSADGPLVFAGFLIRARPDPDVLDPGYLAQYTHTGSFASWVQSTSVRSGQPGINSREYGSLPVPLPPIEEQRAISSMLSDVDRCIDASDRLIEKRRAMKTGVMQQLLTGLRRLPGSAGDWDRVRLGDVLTFLPTASNPRADLGTEGDLAYVHYGDIHGHGSPILDCTTTRLPRIAASELTVRSRLLEGDLVLVDAPEDLEGVGTSAEIVNLGDQPAVAGLHTILCRGDDRHWAPGFKAYLQFIPAFRESLRRVATGTSVYGISKRQVAEIEVQVPPVAEQAAIVSVLSDMENEIAALVAGRIKLRSIKEAMRFELLTGRTRLRTAVTA
jgi:type I restriction enzyme, S subunit